MFLHILCKFRQNCFINKKVSSATPLLLRRPAPARPMSYRSKNLITRNLDCILYIPKISDLQFYYLLRYTLPKKSPLLLRRPAPARPMSYRSQNLITRNLVYILYIPKVADLQLYYFLRYKLPKFVTFLWSGRVVSCRAVSCRAVKVLSDCTLHYFFSYVLRGRLSRFARS